MSISLKTRQSVLRRDKFCCRICGRTACDGVKLEVDHRTPTSKGGSDAEENLWTLCDACNKGKGNRWSDGGEAASSAEKNISQNSLHACGFMWAWNMNGEVRMGPFPDTCGWSSRYDFISGACWGAMHDFTRDQMRAYLFQEALALILEYGVDPKAVDREFSKIAEYRDGWDERRSVCGGLV